MVFNHQIRVREQGSVPFVWEEKPGLPKKNCKSKPVMAYLLPPPLKLEARVPFKWEEKPGTPLVHTQLRPASPFLPHPPVKYNGFPSPSSSPNPVRRNLSSVIRRRIIGKVNPKTPSGFSSTSNDDSSSVVSKAHEEENDGDDEDEDGDNGDDEMFELELEGFTFNDDSRDHKHSDSAPSLLANCLITNVELFSAVPVDQSPTDGSWSCQKSLIWNETDKETSETDYNYGNSSLGRTSGGISPSLEFQFPLFSPGSSFLNKVCGHYQSSPTVSIGSWTQKQRERNGYAIARRIPTLGELIALSRRRNRMKNDLPIQHVIPIKKRSSLLDFFKKAFACCIPYDDEQKIFWES